MFTAIVFDHATRAHLLGLAASENMLTPEAKLKADHVTLAMGRKEGIALGAPRMLTVTHKGEIAGRVCAFRVSGAEDSKNKVPHITVATFGDAKPKESNDITEWVPLDEPQTIWGRVEIRIANTGAPNTQADAGEGIARSVLANSFGAE